MDFKSSKIIFTRNNPLNLNGNNQYWQFDRKTVENMKKEKQRKLTGFINQLIWSSTSACIRTSGLSSSLFIEFLPIPTFVVAEIAVKVQTSVSGSIGWATEMSRGLISSLTL